MSYPSLVPWIAGSDPPPPVEPLTVTGLPYYANREAVAFEGLKYIHMPTSGVEELYDLTFDPGERSAIVLDDPETIDRARQLLQADRARSEALKRSYGLDAPEKVGLDAGTVRNLKALGYIQ